MAAPLGFKTFNSGDVLTAADTNGYLMQGVWTFANAAARTAAVTSPQEGNVSFLKDTNSLEIYDGAAWVAYGSGDITGVTAGTGLTGGGTSGTVTVSLDTSAVIQPTIVDAKGDLIAGTAADTVARLAVGTNGQVLLADSTTATGLKWGSSSPSYTWTSWSPQFKQGGTNLTTSSNTSRYIEIGNLVIVCIKATYSSAGAAGGQLWITSVPVAVASGSELYAAGSAQFYDASAGSRYYGATSIGAGSSVQFASGINKTTFYWGETGSDMTQTIASGDQIEGFIIYQK